MVAKKVIRTTSMTARLLQWGKSKPGPTSRREQGRGGKGRRKKLRKVKKRKGPEERDRFNNVWHPVSLPEEPKDNHNKSTKHRGRRRLRKVRAVLRRKTEATRRRQNTKKQQHQKEKSTKKKNNPPQTHHTRWDGTKNWDKKRRNARNLHFGSTQDRSTSFSRPDWERVHEKDTISQKSRARSTFENRSRVPGSRMSENKQN